MTRPDHPRRRLSELVVEALAVAARLTLGLLRDDEHGRAVRAELADDIEHITAHVDPNGPEPRLRYRWTWNDAPRAREAARSLGIAVDVVSRDGADRFELGCWRVRDLLDSRGRPVDCLDSLRHLQKQLRLGDVPDTPAALTDAGPAIPEAPINPWLASELAHRRWLEQLDPTATRLVLAALTGRACCTGNGDRELSELHRAAHVAAARIELHGRVPAMRAQLLARLHGAQRQGGPST